MRYKELLKKKGGKDSEGLVPVESQIKPGLLKKQMRNYMMS